MYIYMYIHIYIYTRYIHMYLYIHVLMCVCVRIYAITYMSLSPHEHNIICKRTGLHVYDIYIHTHKQTHTL